MLAESKDHALAMFRRLGVSAGAVARSAASSSCNSVAFSRRFIHIEKKIAELGYVLPPLPPEPKGNYMNYTRAGNTIYLSGHLPQRDDGTLVTGRLGENVSTEEGQVAARLAALQMLSTVKRACGDLDRVSKVLKVKALLLLRLLFMSFERNAKLYSFLSRYICF
jgi:enamine deaminase RidA (YjgF/YER057c/UK114 family)